MTPLYVGYFTIGTGYQSEAVECMKTLDGFGLEHEFVGVYSAGSWVRNCAKKPEVIRDLQLKHDGRPLVYLDADARVRRKPIAFELIPPDVDFGCHYRHGLELLSGTLYIGVTTAARNIVRQWCNACKLAPDVWDQRHLQTVLDGGGKDYRIWKMPSEYVRIFDDPKMGQPVIEHMQASRRLAATA
jgi:hypothetical protein